MLHPRLDEKGVHVWWASLVQPDPVISRLHTCLAADERQRAQRIRFERGRQQFVVSRSVMRLILGNYLGVSPERLSFEYQRWGKPVLAPRMHAADLRFNVAHSQDLVIVGITRGRDIGVDLEYLRPVPDLLRIAERFFSPSEHAALRALPEEDRLVGFYNCWTRKEAFIKARGRGLSYPLDSFAVTLHPGEPARLLSIAGGKCDASGWWLKSLQPESGYVGAVVVQDRELELTCWGLMQLDTV